MTNFGVMNVGGMILILVISIIIGIGVAFVDHLERKENKKKNGTKTRKH